uniref:Gustatory receptor n=1 Tax=Lutzomyia longipalpis TaxID=7200 RepID=A0A240SXT1_LUTLO
MSVKEKICFDRTTSFFYYFNIIVGLGPFSYDSKKRIYKKSFKSLAYSWFILIMCLCVMPFVLSNYVKKLKTTIRSDFAVSVAILRILLQWISVIVTALSNIWLRNQHIFYLNSKKTLNKTISIKIGTLYRMRYVLLLSLAKLVIFLCRFFGFYGVMLRVSNFNVIYFILAFITFFPTSIYSINGCNFYMEISSLRFFTFQINYCLSQLLKCVQKMPKKLSKAQRMLISCRISDKIDELSIMYAQLQETLLILNNIYATMLLLFFTNKLFEWTMQVFLEFITMTGYSAFHTGSSVFIQNIMNNIFSIIDVVITMSETAQILHEFPIHKVDDRLRESISQFSIQILQRKRPISIYGMFDVDNTLLYSMVTSMTSYLILLIQFQLGILLAIKLIKYCINN